tara:strand:+ start:3503 stop:4594 length:1092 start_codon:yes stop_codon:yes gene_type:complete
MPILSQSNRKNVFNIEIKVNDLLIDSWSSLSYVAKVNSARAISFEAHGHVPQEALQLGAIIEIKAGVGIVTPTTELLHFKGVIKMLSPSFDKVVVTAIDYITHLATSEYTKYTFEDSQGHDLYFLSANAANYKGIDVSGLIAGADVFLDLDSVQTNLIGHQTRKEFLDNCFNDMTSFKSSTEYPANTYLQWRYAIRSGTKMDFFLPDAANINAEPVYTFSREKNNLHNAIVGSIDTSRIINSCRFVSSSDETIHETYTDSSSVDTYGVSSKLIKYDSTRRDRLEQLAYQLVELHKFPTISYNIQINTLEPLNLGDIVKVKIPSLERNDILPIEEYTLTIDNGIKATYTVGQKRLSTSQILKLL